MIKTKEDLKRYISADKTELEKGSNPKWMRFLLRGDNYMSFKLEKLLRYSEYYRNNRHRGLYFKIMDTFYKLRYSWLQSKYDCQIAPNSCGPGLRITHPRGIMVSWDAKIGKNVGIRRNTLLGNSLYDHKAPTVGDYVQLGVGAQAVGDIKIGRGAMVCNNAVVMRKVPPYAIVAGNPAKVIGFTMNPSEVLEFEKDKYPEEERTSLETLEKNYEKYYTLRFKDINKMTSLC